MSKKTKHGQDTTIHKLVISEGYKDTALKQVQKMVDGNQFDSTQIKLENFDGEVLQFQAENILTIQTKISHKTVPSRIEGPIKLDNEVAVNDAIQKAYITLSKDKDMGRKIRDVVLKRKDQGFAQDNIIIPLPFWSKEYVVLEPCQICKTAGHVQCRPCGGTGTEHCSQCHGSRMCQCTHCGGAQMIQGPQGSKIQCPICHGVGRTTCTTCGQSGRVNCRTCGSKGVTPCPNCQGRSWSSHITIVEIEARTAFDYPRDKLPEKIVALVEKLGVKIKEHGTIKISQAQASVVNADKEEKQQEEINAIKNNNYRIPIIYNITLPYGHVEYDINGTIYYMFLFGSKGKLTHVSPFLDDLIKGGMRKIDDAANNRGDPVENLRQSIKYRTLKEGLIYVASNPVRKAQRLLKNTNKFGLSDNAIKDICIKIDKALKIITDKPRSIGLVYSGILNLCLFSIYFILPIRTLIINKIPNNSLHIWLDFLVLGSGIAIGALTIQIVAYSAIQNAMRIILPHDIKKAALPKLGIKAFWNAGIITALFFICLEISRYVGASSVSWYYNLF